MMMPQSGTGATKCQVFLGLVAVQKSTSTKYPGSFLRETRKSQKEATYAGGYDSEVHALVGGRYSFCIYRWLQKTGGHRAAHSGRASAGRAAHGDAVRISGAD